MNKKWSEKTTLEKVTEIISGIALVVWLVFEYMDRKNKVPYAELASCLAMIVVCVCQALYYWNEKRSFSYIAIGGAVLLVTVVIFTAMFIA